MINIEHFTFNAFQTRCSVAWDETGACAIVDPGASGAEETAALEGVIAAKGLKPTCIMLTHCHFDHIFGVAELVRKYGIPVHMHKEEVFTIETTNPTVCGAYGLPLPDVSFMKDHDIEPIVRYVKDGDIIEVGTLRFEVIETPGHSKGGVCYLERNTKVLFSGDTIFAGAIGRTDHPGGNYDTLMKSIFEKLLSLDGETAVIPGHGPESDISTERMTNPFLLPFNEPYEE